MTELKPIIETGGWTIIRGEKRFVPLGFRQPRGFCPHCHKWFTIHSHETNLATKHCPYCKKEITPHCISCLFYGKYGNTCSQGHFTNPYAEASSCEQYQNRTWSNR